MPARLINKPWVEHKACSAHGRAINDLPWGRKRFINRHFCRIDRAKNVN